jgi:hypothetical protein
VGAEGEVPIRIAKIRIELAKGGVVLLFAPSESTILQVNLVELARMEGVAEAVDTAMIVVPLILVARAVYLVEVTRCYPLGPWRWLLSQELCEEGIFATRGCRAINRRDLEGDTRLADEDHGRQAVNREHNIRNIHDTVVPEKQDAAPSAQRRPVGKALEPGPSQKGSGKLIHSIKLGLLEASQMTGSCSNSLVDSGPTIWAV